VTQTFVWVVNNPAPVAVDDSYGAFEDAGPAVVGNAVTDNDTDVDGDALTAEVQTSVLGSSGGLFSIASDGSVTFDPNGDFEDLAVGETRTTTFVYVVTDADGATDSATVTVTVTGQNDAPQAVGTIVDQTNDDSTPASLDVTSFFTDPDATDVLKYSDGGTLPPGLSIDPDSGLISGTLDSSASAGGPYTVVITADDQHGGTVTQTFVWVVNNPAPVAVDDSYGAFEDAGPAVVGNAVTDNDTDVDGDALTAEVQTSVLGSSGGLFSIASDGAVTFDPNGDFEDLAVGETRTTTFVYVVTDADGATDSATVTVTVTGQNDAPQAVGTIVDQTNDDSTPASLDVTSFFTDPDATDVLKYSDGGTLPPGLSIDPDSGLISGTLDSSASAGGPYTVVITADDQHGGTVTQTFVWVVNNPAPVAVDDSYGAFEDAGPAVVGNAVTDNDTDVDGDALTAEVQTSVLGSSGGLFSIATDGAVTFNPNGDFEDLAVGETRTTTFVYVVTDADGATDSATVTVTVTGQNDAPQAVGTIVDQTNDDSTPASLDVTSFFTDPDATDVLKYSDGGTLPPGLSIDPDSGLISGTLDSSASAGGPYTVVITADDQHGGTVTQTFVWVVNNPAPVAVDDSYGAFEDAGPAVVGNAVTDNDTDVDGDALTAEVQTSVLGSSGGLFSITSDGSVTFDPNGDFEDLAVGETRTTTFVYVVTDADGATDSATVTVTVTGQNDAPQAVGTIVDQTNDDSTPASLDVTSFFSDPDATDVLKYSDGGTLAAGVVD
jgi:VCBS repeat-containing protein